jgi:hypothetical protein
MKQQGRCVLPADETGRVLDRLTALEKVISPTDIRQVLEETGRVNPRACTLTHEIMMWIVLAMGVFTNLPIRQVFKHARRLRVAEQTPCRSALCVARQRLGVEPLKRLFERTVLDGQLALRLAEPRRGKDRRHRRPRHFFAAVGNQPLQHLVQLQEPPQPQRQPDHAEVPHRLQRDPLQTHQHRLFVIRRIVVVRRIEQRPLGLRLARELLAQLGESRSSRSASTRPDRPPAAAANPAPSDRTPREPKRYASCRSCAARNA